MRIRKTASIFLALLFVLSLCSLNAFASSAEETDISMIELPKPSAPKYMMFDAADRTANEGSDMLEVIAMFDEDILELSVAYDTDSEAFLEKYGLYTFDLYVQLDSSLDGTDAWNYTEEWDSYYGATGTGNAAACCGIRSDMFECVALFDLYTKITYEENYEDLGEALIRKDVPDGDYTFTNYYFDYENHNLSVRMRYYMYWETYDGETIGEGQSKVSEWSDVVVFGKDGNYVTPEEPTGYEAPYISDLKYVAPAGESEIGSLSYMQDTSEQVWMAGIYYKMTENGSFDGLETQISVNGGDWVEYTTVDSWGNWCLYNGERTAYCEEPRIEADSNINLRVRFSGTHGPSEWSNVLELNGGGTQVVPDTSYEPTTSEEISDTTTAEPKEEKCSLCGFCPVPFGLCIFIWLVIIIAVILLIFIVIKISKKDKKEKKEK